MRTTIEQLRQFSTRQWKIAGWSYLAALLAMGAIGETLPGASEGRVVPVGWWNWLTLGLSPPLIALIAATFVPDGQPKRARRREGAVAGAGGAIGTPAMACPVCNPLAIPLFGTAGVLSFLAPERGAIALLSILLLTITLGLRLRTTRACRIAGQPAKPGVPASVTENAGAHAPPVNEKPTTLLAATGGPSPVPGCPAVSGGNPARGRLARGLCVEGDTLALPRLGEEQLRPPVIMPAADNREERPPPLSRSGDADVPNPTAISARPIPP